METNITLKAMLIIPLIFVISFIYSQESRVLLNERYCNKLPEMQFIDHALLKNNQSYLRNFKKNIRLEQVNSDSIINLWNEKVEQNTLYQRERPFMSEEIIYLLDSVITFSYYFEGSDSLYSSKLIYDYDSNGNQILREYYPHWDYIWIGLYKIETNFDSNGKWTFTISYLWDYEMNDWKKYSKNEYNNGQIYYLWDTKIDDWVPNIKNTGSYDENSRLALETTYHWSSKVEDWIEYSMSEYNYNTIGKRYLTITYNWDPQIKRWEEYAKNEVSYDSIGNQTLLLDYNWDSDINNWVEVSKQEYDYGIDNKITLYERYIWDPDIDNWQGDTKDEYNYDDSGNEVLNASYGWNSDTKDWAGFIKVEHNYESNNRRTSSTRYFWDSNINNWKLDSNVEQNYDDNDNIVLTIRYSFSREYSDPVLSEKTFYYYRKLNTATHEFPVSNLLIYPNPVSKYLSINSTKEFNKCTLELYNMQGQKVLYKELLNRKSVNLQGIKPGVYLYSFIIDNEIQSGKLIKK